MTKTQVMPNLLIQIVEFLKENPINLSKQKADGRPNSLDNEKEVIDCLRDNSFKIIKSDDRDWHDFTFCENDIFYPVNIKVSTTKTVDNVGSKLGIYYALT
ncbi:MAG: restriction endonuclease, partial [Helicobacter sp.]|nr:restriction endonuclease [Helicobacter sp.]